MKLTPLPSDRAAGVLVAVAAGDGLGAGYEFGEPLAASTPVTMKVSGPFDFAAGEWRDDTSMAIPIAQALVDARTAGTSPVASEVWDAIVRAWTTWAADAKDVGSQTRQVIDAAKRASAGEVTAAGVLPLRRRRAR